MFKPPNRTKQIKLICSKPHVEVFIRQTVSEVQVVYKGKIRREIRFLGWILLGLPQVLWKPEHVGTNNCSCHAGPPRVKPFLRSSPHFWPLGQSSTWVARALLGDDRLKISWTWLCYLGTFELTCLLGWKLSSRKTAYRTAGAKVCFCLGKYFVLNGACLFIYFFATRPTRSLPKASCKALIPLGQTEQKWRVTRELGVRVGLSVRTGRGSERVWEKVKKVCVSCYSFLFHPLLLLLTYPQQGYKFNSETVVFIILNRRSWGDEWHKTPA